MMEMWLALLALGQQIEDPANTAEAVVLLSPLLVGVYVFALAVFVGFEIITKIPPTLHTPLMSGANAVSGITIVGALYCANSHDVNTANILGFLAITFATINVVGGFVVTDRMLKMFTSKGK